MTTIVGPGPIVHAFAAYKEPSLEEIVRSLRSRGWSTQLIKKLIKTYAHRTKTPLPWRQNAEHENTPDAADCSACEPQAKISKKAVKRSLRVTAKAIIGANRLLNAARKKRRGNSAQASRRKWCTKKCMCSQELSTHRLKIACGKAKPPVDATRNDDTRIEPISRNILDDYAFYAQGKLGSGAHSLVYKVIDRKTGIKYACKCIKKDTLGLVATKGLLQEASLMREMDHPSIVRLWKMYEDKSMYYLVLDLVQGGELFDRVVNLAKFTECEARNTTRVLLDVIFYLHNACGIVHRDIKPENILCISSNSNTDIKLCDFGYAAKIDPKNPHASLSRLCGTPSYLAPEVLLRIPYGPAADMWSIGCVVFILLCGYAPFSDDGDPTSLKKNIVSANYAFSDAHWSNVSQCGKDFVSRLLTVDPDLRMSAHEALHHPWISEKANILESHDLTSSICKLRHFHTTTSAVQSNSKKNTSIRCCY